LHVLLRYSLAQEQIASSRYESSYSKWVCTHTDAGHCQVAILKKSRTALLYDRHFFGGSAIQVSGFKYTTHVRWSRLLTFYTSKCYKCASIWFFRDTKGLRLFFNIVISKWEFYRDVALIFIFNIPDTCSYTIFELNFFTFPYVCCIQCSFVDSVG